MEDNKLTREVKRHAVIIAINAKHSDLEISQFFNVTRSFVHKVHRELEASDSNVESVAKRIKRKPRSDTVRTSQFVQQVQEIRGISGDLQVSEYTIHHIVHKDIQYKCYVMHSSVCTNSRTVILPGKMTFKQDRKTS